MSGDLPKAVCVVLLDNMLMVMAVSRKDDHKKFGLPGGKVDPGESDEDAARREMLEETGITIKNLRPILRSTCVGGDQDYDTTTFLAKFDPTVPCVKPKAGEGVAKYVEWGTLFEGPFGSYNFEVTTALRKLLEGLL